MVCGRGWRAGPRRTPRPEGVRILEQTTPEGVVLQGSGASLHTATGGWEKMQVTLKK